MAGVFPPNIHKFSTMRKRFEQQTALGRMLIEDVEIPTKKRMGPIPSLLAALKEIYINPKWNKKVFDILEEHICPDNGHTGRPGMDLWQIFVLAQVRNCKNISYDELHYLTNHDSLLRRMMGIAVEPGFQEHEQHIGYQTIIDNVGLLNDEMLKEINQVIVSFGHKVFKKKGTDALRLKTDSFVVESNVHFPTDYNLLGDCIHKCVDTTDKLGTMRPLPGWRKSKHWRRDLKNRMRALGRASSSGGKNKQERIKAAATAYLTKAKALYAKLVKTRASITTVGWEEIMTIFALDYYLELMNKHIDLVERRLINGEKIPHQEKMFSIFETYTEWIKKGKKHPSVELGKKVAITSDQYHLAIDYRVMEHQADSEIIEEIYKDLPSRGRLESWSFDKGFWNKANKAFLSDKVDLLVLPKKGKLNKKEREEEHRPKFKKRRHQHSAIESNINELEHRGLDRCPDRGFGHFKRYVGIAVCSYNLKKIGKRLIEEKRKKKKPPAKKAA